MSSPEGVVVFSRNVADRLVVFLDTPGSITVMELDDVQDIISASQMELLDPVSMTPLTYPISLTKSAANDRVWYTQDVIAQSVGEYVAEFSTDDAPATFIYDLQVSEDGSLPSPTMQYCSLEGNVVDSQGVALQNVSISARMLALPVVTGSVGVSAGLKTVVTDANGFFTLPMLRSATIDVIISEISYRRTLIVPDASSADLFSIP